MRTEQFLIAAPATTMLPSCAFEELQAEAKAKADKAKKVGQGFGFVVNRRYPAVAEHWALMKVWW